MDPE
jgi:meiotic recombination protein DMC1